MGPKAAAIALKTHLPVKGLIRQTIFGQFCGGEDIEECREVSQFLAQDNIGTILDFATEGSQTEKSFDRVRDEVKKTIDESAQNPSIPFAVFKPTGIGRAALLEKRDRKLSLTMTEQNEFERFKERFEDICQYAAKKKVRILVDAEESWIQDSVDSLVRVAMLKHNKKEAIIFNTIQHYRKDRLDFLKASYGDAAANGYFLGVKLVRGAYLEKEAKKAQELGYSNPLHSSKEASDQDYNLGLRFCMENIDQISLCAGTHNEKSTKILMELMAESSLERNDKRVCFAQLFGMSDNLSYNLAKYGYNVAKYLPYGPLSELLPYLSRRAEENSSIQGQTGRELSMIEKELERRKSH